MSREKRKIILYAFIMACIGALLSIPFFAGAGSLDPPPEATDTEGNPYPTMKTLNEIPPTWSQILPGSERFVWALGLSAVMDKETGLVWDNCPPSSITGPRNWYEAAGECYKNWSFSHRYGFRLPTIEELASLIDSSQSDPALPSGSTFETCGTSWGIYWTSTTSPYSPDWAYAVDFRDGTIRVMEKTTPFSEGIRVWCVRGGHGHDAY